MISSGCVEQGLFSDVRSYEAYSLLSTSSSVRDSFDWHNLHSLVGKICKTTILSEI